MPAHSEAEVEELKTGPLGKTVPRCEFTFLSIRNASFPSFQFSIPDLCNQISLILTSSQKLSRCFAFGAFEWELQQTSLGDGCASLSSCDRRVPHCSGCWATPAPLKEISVTGLCSLRGPQTAQTKLQHLRIAHHRKRHFFQGGAVCV